MDPHWNEARLGHARGRGLRFDSDEGLPLELRNVRIQRFVAKMPPPGWLGRLLGAEARPSADEVLEQQSRQKESTSSSGKSSAEWERPVIVGLGTSLADHRGRDV
jgi:hypothetical protein